jgi:hypothetical protein
MSEEGVAVASCQTDTHARILLVEEEGAKAEVGIQDVEEAEEEEGANADRRLFPSPVLFAFPDPFLARIRMIAQLGLGQ